MDGGRVLCIHIIISGKHSIKELNEIGKIRAAELIAKWQQNDKKAIELLGKGYEEELKEGIKYLFFYREMLISSWNRI